MTHDSPPLRSRAATRKRRRLYAVLSGAVMLAIAAVLVLTAFEDSIVFFYSPTDLAEKQAGRDPVKPDQLLRVGGLVEEDSVKTAADGVTKLFTVTDLKNTLRVSFKGILPDLFREGQGIVSSGSLGPDGIFVATEVLAKHDETYMPPEVADALKRAGEWKGDEEKEKTQ
ncbi:MAG: cytochrome c maturation protein CcmE [Alphaproteobacteria bacterium]|nr:cytochrome c maturation protein CcmE [Alphaproteobacteria bacterium]